MHISWNDNFLNINPAEVSGLYIIELPCGVKEWWIEGKLIRQEFYDIDTIIGNKKNNS